MNKSVFFLFLLFSTNLLAQKITGIVQDSTGAPLPFSTIHVKERNLSISANSEGRYAFSIPAGNYTIICQHIGYQRQEKAISINENTVVNFQLSPQTLTLSEVTVKQGEDPAYEIIRKAIAKRPELKNELQSFRSQVYTKGQLRLRDHPKKFLGQKVDFEDGDTSRRKIIYLSETVSNYSVDTPNKSKIEVIASKVSGESDAYGLSAPQIISFYENNIQIGKNLNPRGFISPIANNALNYYRFKYEGAFFEDGKEISRISVIPGRKFTPLFSGYINIVEDEWRIHSLNLMLTQSSGMELLDTLQIEQLYMPLPSGEWVVKSQVLYPAIKMLGFDAYGSFVNIYSNYRLKPDFARGYFDRTIIRYTDSANKQTTEYWDETRPIVLQEEEINDYLKKHNLEQAGKSPAYMDSIDKQRNRVTISKIIVTGITIGRQQSSTSFSIAPLAQILGYNTVEGFVINFAATLNKRLDSNKMSRKSIAITPEIRYGFSNQRTNANLTATYIFGKKYADYFSIAGGRDVFQFNNAAPVGILGSSVSALLFKKNNFKFYEAGFGTLSFSKGIGAGLSLMGSAQYQDRLPLENTTDFSFNKKEDKAFTANYPLPQFNKNITPHQAFTGSIGLKWHPGMRYIQYPHQMVPVPSWAPAFTFTYTKAFEDVFGSDVDYSKWLFNITDDIRMKLFGNFYYHLDLGGFINSNRVEIPDYTHYKGLLSKQPIAVQRLHFHLYPE